MIHSEINKSLELESLPILIQRGPSWSYDVGLS